jgi:hypothetical protein
MFFAVWLVLGFIGIAAFLIAGEDEFTVLSLIFCLIGWPVGPLFLAAFIISPLSRIVIWRRK